VTLLPDSRWREEQNTPTLMCLADVIGGGTGNHLYELLPRIQKMHWNPVLYTQKLRLDGRVPNGVPVALLPGLENVTVYPFLQFARIVRLRRAALDVQPAIVHAYFFWSILYSRLLKMIGVIPTLIENREDEGFSWGRHEYGWLRLTSHAPDSIICVSNAIRKCVLDKEFTSADRVSVIQNGVDLDFRPLSEEQRHQLRDQLGLSRSDVAVGLVANMNRAVKGVKYFIQTIPHVLRTRRDVRFFVIGDGPERTDLERQTADLGIDKVTQFLGYRDDMNDIYQALDISVLSSLSEGLSIVLLESIKHGLPVVATDVGGNSEVIQDGVNGLLVESRNPVAMAERVLQLVNDRSLRQSMGARGRKIAEEKFDINMVASKYADKYAQVVGNTGIAMPRK